MNSLVLVSDRSAPTSVTSQSQRPDTRDVISLPLVRSDASSTTGWRVTRSALSHYATPTSAPGAAIQFTVASETFRDYVHILKCDGDAAWAKWSNVKGFRDAAVGGLDADGAWFLRPSGVDVRAILTAADRTTVKPVSLAHYAAVDRHWHIAVMLAGQRIGSVVGALLRAQSSKDSQRLKVLTQFAVSRLDQRRNEKVTDWTKRVTADAGNATEAMVLLRAVGELEEADRLDAALDLMLDSTDRWLHKGELAQCDATLALADTTRLSITLLLGLLTATLPLRGLSETRKVFVTRVTEELNRRRRDSQSLLQGLT